MGWGSRLQLHVALVVGAEADAVKLSPVVKALRLRDGVHVTTIASGQQEHRARAALAGFGLAADIELAIPAASAAAAGTSGGGSSGAFCLAFDRSLALLLPRLAPDLLLVHGDSDTAWVAAHVANRVGLAIGHVEAGLRSGHLMLPWPEERNREEIDAMATLLFTPCAKATRAVALLPGRAWQTGNSGIDALRDALGGSLDAFPRRPPGRGRRRLLVLCHRREAIAHVAGLAAALRALAARPDVAIDLLLPPDPLLAAALAAAAGDHPGIAVSPVRGYGALARQLAASDMLLTDSGTLIEAACALGVPALVLRATIERWEAIERGHASLVGLDPLRIRAEAAALLDRPEAYAAMARPGFPYGKGDAAIRIADAIEEWARPAGLARPLPAHGEIAPAMARALG